MTDMSSEPNTKQPWWHAHPVVPRLSAVALVAVFAAVGSHYLNFSSAATATYNHNPIGFVDACSLSGNTTTLYGWSHDPDAPAGALPNVSIKVGSFASVTRATGNQNYRDADINAYIKANYPGMPTSSVYGWSLSMTNLYKGNRFAVSGTMVNYSTGTANPAITVNTTHPVDGRPYFAGGVIPDACLMSVPAPAPAPTPTPPASSGTSGSTKSTGTRSTPSAPAAPAAPAVSSDANATATVGTIAANLSIPTGNATGIAVKYGIDPANLTKTADALSVSGDAVSVDISGLSALSTYSYQIVRTAGSQVTTSPVATFKTKGYAITILFTDGSNKPIKGIAAELQNKKVTSGSDGKVTFSDLSAGTYSPLFSYNGHSYSQDLSTSSAKAADGAKEITLTQTINVSKLSQGLAAASAPTPAAKKSSSASVVIIIVLVLLAIGFVFWWLRRRRGSTSLPEYSSPSAMPAHEASQIPTVVATQQPQPASVVVQTPPTGASVAQAAPVATTGLAQTVPNTKKRRHGEVAVEPVTPPQHMGESLRDMVMRSMAEEAAKNPDKHPNHPIVPGGQ